MGIFKPAWQTDDSRKEDKAKKAVEKVKDQNKLFEIAAAAPLKGVRVHAAAQITDDQLLYRIAADQDSGDSDKRLLAIRHIKDQALLEKLASDLGGYEKKEACKRIQNEDVLARIVVEAQDIYQGEAAFDCLYSQSAFARVALNAADKLWRRHAVGKLTDTVALSMVARDDPDEALRWQAISRLIDVDAPKSYADLVRDWRDDAEKALCAVDRIFDAMALLVIASGTAFEEIRTKCLKKLGRPGLCSDDNLNTDKLGQIIRNCDDEAVREAARKRLEAAQGGSRDAASPSRADALTAAQKYGKPFGENTSIDRMTMSVSSKITEAVNALPPEELAAAYAAQVVNSDANFNFVNRGDFWREVEGRIIGRIQDKPALLLDFVRNPNVLWPMAARCVAELFKLPPDRPDSESLQDEAVAAFLRNIPDYVAMSSKKAAPREEKHFLLMLAQAIPSTYRERYGFSLGVDRDRVTYRGKLYIF